MAMHAQPIQENARVEVRTRFGTLPVHPEKLITFPRGLPGFDGLRQFALFHDEDCPEVFYLQSVEDPAIRLPLTRPHHFRIDYRITLDEDELAALEAEDTSGLEICLIVSDDPEHGLRANFLGPIVLHPARRRALQKVLSDPQGTLVISGR